MSKLYLRIALPVPLRCYFDYLPLPGHDYVPGMRVNVPFGRRQLVGVIVELTAHTTVPANKLKIINECLDDVPVLTKPVLALATWACDYYHYPLGEALKNLMPTKVRKGAALPAIKLPKMQDVSSEKPDLNQAQQQAVDAVLAKTQCFERFLLDGVTGSGKTEVYLRVIEKVAQSGRQALVLVPEIGLTPQTLARFQARFSEPVVALHSGLKESTRLNAWLMAKSGDAKVVIGTRLAVFTPFADLGVIIIDEEHDLSFKQQEGFQYNARDVALMRAKQSDIPIVLGTATPSLESFQNTIMARYQHLKLPLRAGQSQQPQIQLIDIRQQQLTDGMSPALIELIKQHLAEQGQVLIFLNRRGFSPVLMCHQCGWVACCKHCDARLTVHLAQKKLRCHHCDAYQPRYQQCPSCQGSQLINLGLGTERLEESCQKCFPNIGIVRIDRDSTRLKGALQEKLDSIINEENQLILGTQMLAKGHHFPKVSLAVILDADSGLFSTDFRATERMGQLLTQVAGRAGRSSKLGTVAIQTRHPDHPLLKCLLTEGYTAFAQQLLAEREQAQLPPFNYFALLRAESSDPESAFDFLAKVKDQNKNQTVAFQGPVPAPMKKRAGKFRAQLLLQANSRKPLQATLIELTKSIEQQKLPRQLKWTIDVDPQEMV